MDKNNTSKGINYGKSTKAPRIYNKVWNGGSHHFALWRHQFHAPKQQKKIICEVNTRKFLSNSRIFWEKYQKQGYSRTLWSYSSSSIGWSSNFSLFFFLSAWRLNSKHWFNNPTLNKTLISLVPYLIFRLMINKLMIPTMSNITIPVIDSDRINV